MPEDFDLIFLPSVSDYIEVSQKNLTRNVKRSLIMHLFIIPVVLIVLYFLLNRSFLDLLLILIYFECGVFFLVLCYFPLNRLLIFFKVKNNPKYLSEVSYSLKSSGFALTSLSSKNELDWRSFKSVWEDSRYIYLNKKTNSDFTVFIPKRIFSTMVESKIIFDFLKSKIHS